MTDPILPDFYYKTEFLKKAKANIEQKLALLSALEGRGFKVQQNELLSPLEFTTYDLSLADDVVIRNPGKEDRHCHEHSDFIDLIHYASIPSGVVSVYCKVSDKNKAIAIQSGMAGLKIHSIDFLLEFYEQQGVKQPVLAKLKHELEHLYSQIPNGAKVSHF